MGKYLAAFIFLSLFLLAGCAGEKILFISDPYYYEARLGEGGKLKELISAAAGRRQSLEFVVLDPGKDWDTEIRQLAAGGAVSAVMLSPLAALYRDSVLSVFPETPVFALDPAENSENNRPVGVSYDRSEAFATAASLAGKTAGGMKDSNGIAVCFFFTGTEKRLKERDSFMETFAAYIDPGNVYEFSIESLDNKEKVDSIVSDAAVKHAALVVVFASSFNPAVIDKLLTADTRLLVTEDAGSGAVSFSTPIISVEEDPADFLKAVLDAAGKKLPGKLVINAAAVEINKGKMFDKGS